jgi:hypothetical protein
MEIHYELLYFLIHMIVSLSISKIVDKIPVYSDMTWYLIIDSVIRLYLIAFFITKYDTLVYPYTFTLLNPLPMNGYLIGFFQSKLKTNIELLFKRFNIN